MRKLFARFSKKLLQNARRADIIMKLSWIYRLVQHFTEVPISTWMHWLSCFFTYSRGWWFFWPTHLTGFLKNWITIVSLVFEGEHIRRGIEVVITGLTRNQFARKRTRVRIPSSPPLKALGIRCLFSFFGFIQRAKEEPQAHLETIPLLFIALMPACTPQVVFAVALSLFSALHPAWRGTRSDFVCW